MERTSIRGKVKSGNDYWHSHISHIVYRSRIRLTVVTVMSLNPNRLGLLLFREFCSSSGSKYSKYISFLDAIVRQLQFIFHLPLPSYFLSTHFTLAVSIHPFTTVLFTPFLSLLDSITSFLHSTLFPSFILGPGRGRKENTRLLSSPYVLFSPVSTNIYVPNFLQPSPILFLCSRNDPFCHFGSYPFRFHSPPLFSLFLFSLSFSSHSLSSS